MEDVILPRLGGDRAESVNDSTTCTSSYDAKQSGNT